MRTRRVVGGQGVGWRRCAREGTTGRGVSAVVGRGGVPRCVRQGRVAAASALGVEREATTEGASEEGRTATYDLVIVGAGPSGLAVAERVASSGRKVCVVDPKPTAVWPNNYGVWIDEFEALGLEDCLDKTWSEATVFLDSGAEDEKTLRRPYGRVDRKKLKTRLYERCLEHEVRFKEALAKEVKNFTPKGAGGVGGAMGWDNLPLSVSGYSVVTCSDGTELRGKLVLDATGHAKKFVQFRDDYDPGYQGAYGVLVEVDKHPFDLDKMLFMDWRDDHLRDLPELKARNDRTPTFLYAMPFSETEIFLEETSLVARPAVPFDDLKERMEARLKHLGINIKSVHEEEFCLIPMGSSLPYVPQRVLGIGGTAGMVHPSTGYMVSRMLGAAPGLADSIIDILGGGQPKIGSEVRMPAASSPRQAESSSSSSDAFVETGNEANDLSVEVWDAAWPEERLAQREFFNFGMEVLLSLDLANTREFFSAFFSLSDFHWQGFLSSRLSLPELIVFGLSLFSKSSWDMRFSLVAKGLPGLVGMLAGIARGTDKRYLKDN
ncbi:lycopene beta cyclase [Chloropicon primus]|uniref:lycopene beta-cyclase n=1 Tax=Chloropicon primus TaxID=1764295 RepID=A0A5B8MF76_9CHLO|nr:lycopene beta cyclase [Chloropicon primus]|eukprot:QDZ18931.1 lycopene beta cyclase [Chloropicon primus]